MHEENEGSCGWSSRVGREVVGNSFGEDRQRPGVVPRQAQRKSNSNFHVSLFKIIKVERGEGNYPRFCRFWRMQNKQLPCRHTQLPLNYQSITLQLPCNYLWVFARSGSRTLGAGATGLHFGSWFLNRNVRFRGAHVQIIAMYAPVYLYYFMGWSADKKSRETGRVGAVLERKRGF